MSAVAIVGAGEIGAAAAYGLASSDRVRRIWLIDAAAGAAAGKALDIQQSGAVRRLHARLEGTGDWSRIVGCDACIVADHFTAGAGEWHGDEGLATLTRVMPYFAGAPIVLAGASQVELLARLATETGIERERLVGSAPEALASSLAAIVALEARCSPREVSMAVLGTPPAGLVVPWSSASIAGYALLDVLSQVQLARLEARCRHLWPPGPYALGAAAALVAGALLARSRRSFNVVTQLQGEFGVRNRPGVVQATLAPQGIGQIRAPQLTPRERAQLQTALGG